VTLSLQPDFCKQCNLCHMATPSGDLIWGVSPICVKLKIVQMEGSAVSNTHLTTKESIKRYKSRNPTSISGNHSYFAWHRSTLATVILQQLCVCVCVCVCERRERERERDRAIGVCMHALSATRLLEKRFWQTSSIENQTSNSIT
jgi:hypothetical protein